MGTTGTAYTTLIVLRGNSGSGKSTAARAVRKRLGRGTAWVEQDYLRRILLREHDVAGGANIGLIDLNVRYALDHSYDVLLEGILDAGRYGDMLSSLHATTQGGRSSTTSTSRSRRPCTGTPPGRSRTR